MKKIICKNCNNEFNSPFNTIRKFCSRECFRKFYSGDNNSSKKPEVKEKIRIKLIGNKNGIGNCGPGLIGNKNPNWIEDRSKLKVSERHDHDSRYKEWNTSVKNRDKWKCKINDNNCKGKLEAHHILSWSQFPQLRYNINNGISLCRFHHPRKRKDEIKLAPIFQELVLAIV